MVGSLVGLTEVSLCVHAATLERLLGFEEMPCCFLWVVLGVSDILLDSFGDPLFWASMAVCDNVRLG